MLRGYGSMTSFSIVLVAWFAEVSLEKPPIMAIMLFLDRPHAKTRDNLAIGWEKLQRKPPFIAIMLFSVALVPKTATTHRQLGKFLRKPPIMATTLFLGRDRAKARDNPRTGLGKFLRKSPIMATSLSWTPFVPKRPTGLGKIRRKPPIMAIPKKWRDLLGLTVSPKPCGTASGSIPE